MIVPYEQQTEQFMLLYYHSLSEKDKRLYAAVESAKLGWGGTTYISRLLSISRTTVISAKKEMMAALLQPQQLVAGRQRKAGGGRKKKYRQTS